MGTKLIIMEWIFPLWACFWDQCSLFSSVKLEKLVTYITKIYQIHKNGIKIKSSAWVDIRRQSLPDLIVCWIRSSVSRSTAAVASSRMRTLFLRSRARARHTSCLWPTLKSTKNLIHQGCIHKVTYRSFWGWVNVPCGWWWQCPARTCKLCTSAMVDDQWGCGQVIWW